MDGQAKNFQNTVFMTQILTNSYCGDHYGASKWIIIMLILLFCSINWLSVTWASFVNSCHFLNCAVSNKTFPGRELRVKYWKLYNVFSSLLSWELYLSHLVNWIQFTSFVSFRCTADWKQKWDDFSFSSIFFEYSLHSITWLHRSIQWRTWRRCLGGSNPQTGWLGTAT